MSSYTTRAGGTFIKDRLQGYVSAALRPFRAPASIHQDFEQDVLERLYKLGGNALGAPIVGVQAGLDGQIRIMCMGFCPDGHWRKYTLRFSYVFLNDKKYLGDAQAVAEIAYQVLVSDPPKDKL